MIAWVSRSRACFAEPPAESPSTRNSSDSSGCWQVQSASLPRQGRPGHDFLANDLLRRLQPPLCLCECQLGDLLSRLGVLIEPQGKAVLDHAADERGGLPGRQALFGLAGELRVLEFDGEHETDAVPDIVGRQPDAAWQEVAMVSKLAQRFSQPRAQTIDVCTALRGRNQVDVAFGNRCCIIGTPDQCPVERAPCCLPDCRQMARSAAIRRPPSPRRGIARGRPRNARRPAPPASRPSA